MTTNRKSTTAKAWAELAKSDSKRLDDIKKRWEDAGIQGPWRVHKHVRFGCDVVEPYGAWGRNDVLIATGLDGYTAAFLASVPEDMRFLLSVAEKALAKKKRK